MTTGEASKNVQTPHPFADCKSASSYYDKLAPLYDAATGKEGAWMPNKVMKELLQGLLRPDFDVFDVGFGTGQTIEILIPTIKEEHIVGVDVSLEMLNICSHKYPKAKLSLSDIFSFSSPNHRQFDLLTCIGTFEFIADTEAFFVAVRKLLKRGGILALTFEPVIIHHKLQHLKQAPTVPGTLPNEANENFYTYRRVPSELKKTLCAKGLVICEECEFVAYRKGDQDVIYHAILARAH